MSFVGFRTASRRLTCRFWTAQLPVSRSANPQISSIYVYGVRTYASQKKKGKDKDKDKDKEKNVVKEAKSGTTHQPIDTTQLIPRSQRPPGIETPEDVTLYSQTNEKMQDVINHLTQASTEARLQAGLGVSAQTGAISTEAISRIRVSVPKGRHAGEAGEKPRLSELATVGIRDNKDIIVSIFSEEDMKHIENAIFAAHIPHVVPQRVNSRTIKIPIPKPSVEARQEIAKSFSKRTEDARVQIRRLEQTAVKKGGYEKHSAALDAFHNLGKKHIATGDKVLADLKTLFGVR